MSYSSGTADLKERIDCSLDDEVRPALKMDRGDVEVLGVSDGIVRVRLHGTCSSCPSTVMTAIMGIEEELRKWIPEVEYLEAVP